MIRRVCESVVGRSAMSSSAICASGLRSISATASSTLTVCSLVAMAPSYAHQVGSVKRMVSPYVRLMGMTERDAIRAVDEAIVQLKAMEAGRTVALKAARDAVRAAHQQGYPIAALARRAGKHRNTITEWCNNEGSP